MKLFTLVPFSILLALPGCGIGPFASKEKEVERGNELLAAGNHAEAILRYRKAIQKDSNYVEAFYRLGIAQLQAGKPSDAYFTFSQAVQLDPNHVAAKVQLGDVALTGYLSDPRRPRGLYDAIQKVARELLAKDPQSFDGLRLSGYLAMADSNPQAAAGFFEKADRIKPDQPAVAAAWVQNLFADNQSAAGEAKALKFLDANPAFGPMFDLLFAQYRSAGRLKDAEQILRRKIRTNPGVPYFSIQLAEFFWNTGMQPQADTVIQELTADSRATANTYQEIGDFFSRLRVWDRAVEAYRRGLSLKPKDPTPLQKGIVPALIEQRSLEEAKTVLEQILRATPDDRQARASRASLLMANHKPEDTALALAEFRKLSELEPLSASARYNLSRALRESGQQDEARKQLREVLKVDRNHLNALRDLASMMISKEDADTALQYAEQALTVSPRDPSVRLVRTAAWALQGKTRQVRPELARLLREFPQLFEAQIQLGLLELDEKQYDQAARVFQQHYHPGSSDIRPLKGLVEVALARNQPAEALSLAEQEYRKAPQSKDLLALFATTAERAGDAGKAIEAYEKLSSAEPAQVFFQLRLGQLHMAQNGTAKALAIFEKARQAAPGNAQIPALLGVTLWNAGRREEAIKSYRESLKLNADDTTVMNNLAFALADQKTDLEEAHRLAQMAAQKEPENLYVADTLGYVYLKRGNQTSALQVFEGLVRKAPSSAQFRFHLALARAEIGDRAKARQDLETALQLKPGAPLDAQVRSLLQSLR